MNEIMAISNEAPGSLEQLSPSATNQQIRFAVAVLKRLYFGLIPIEATVNGLSVRSVEGADSIVETPTNDSVLSKDVTFSELRITTLSNEANFWTDIRRALYTGNEFTVLVRVVGDSIQHSSYSLPLLDVMKNINSDAFDSLFDALDNMSSMNIESTESADQMNVSSFDKVLSIYGAKILSYARKKSASRIQVLEEYIASLTITDFSLPSQIKYFDLICKFLDDQFNVTAKDQLKIKYRSEARREAGIQLLEPKN
jgi:hypothetical protein